MVEERSLNVFFEGNCFYFDYIYLNISLWLSIR